MDFTTAILLVLASSLAWAALDLSRKVLADRMAALPLLFFMTLFAAPIFALWGWFSAGRPWIHDSGYWWPAVASVVLNIAANLLYLRAVRLSPYSQMVPLLALTPVFAAFGGMLLVGEYPSLRQWAGILTVSLGAFVLQSRSLNPRRGGRGLVSAFLAEPGAPLMTAVALFWAIATALDKAAIAHAEGLFHGFVLNGAVALAILPWFLARGGVAQVRNLPRIAMPLAAALVVGVLALGLQLRALTVVPVSLVETVKRGLGLVLAIGLGRAVFGEPVTRPKLAAATLMAAGVALILL